MKDTITPYHFCHTMLVLTGLVVLGISEVTDTTNMITHRSYGWACLAAMDRQKKWAVAITENLFVSPELNHESANILHILNAGQLYLDRCPCRLEIIIWLVPSLIGGAVVASMIRLVLGPLYPIAMNQVGHVLPQWLLTGSIYQISKLWSNRKHCYSTHHGCCFLEESRVWSLCQWIKLTVYLQFDCDDGMYDGCMMKSVSYQPATFILYVSYHYNYIHCYLSRCLTNENRVINCRFKKKMVV